MAKMNKLEMSATKDFGTALTVWLIEVGRAILDPRRSYTDAANAADDVIEAIDNLPGNDAT